MDGAAPAARARRLRARPHPPSAALAVADTHSYFTASHAEEALSFECKASSSGVYAALLTMRRACGRAVALVPALQLLAATLLLDAHDQLYPAGACARAALVALVYALLPPPSSLPAQPALYPPMVSGGLPLIGHLPSFLKGPVNMIDGLRDSYRSMFTIRVGPQRITFMVGAPGTLAFIKQKDEMLDQAPVYGFTIPVFGKGIVYDSPSTSASSRSSCSSTR